MRGGRLYATRLARLSFFLTFFFSFVIHESERARALPVRAARYNIGELLVH